MIDAKLVCAVIMPLILKSVLHPFLTVTVVCISLNT